MPRFDLLYTYVKFGLEGFWVNCGSLGATWFSEDTIDIVYDLVAKKRLYKVGEVLQISDPSSVSYRLRRDPSPPSREETFDFTCGGSHFLLKKRLLLLRTTANQFQRNPSKGVEGFPETHIDRVVVPDVGFVSNP